jgi:hypothetical protein
MKVGRGECKRSGGKGCRVQGMEDKGKAEEEGTVSEPRVRQGTKD